MTKHRPLPRSNRFTLLQRLLDERGVTSASVEAKLKERLGDRAPGRRQIVRWRLGQNEPRRKEMVRLLWAIREIARDAEIRIDQIFNFDPNDPGNWES